MALVLCGGVVSTGGVAVAAIAAVAPANTALPTISGPTTQGQTLTASPGTWTGTTPLTFAYHWQRCNASGASCVGPIATGPTHVLGSDSVGNTFRVRVTATNSAGATSATSAATAVVSASSTTTTTTATTTTPTSSTTPVTTPTSTTPGCLATGATVPVADVSLPSELEIDGTQISPSAVTYGTRTLTVRVHVSACGGSVEGALVYATAVPYGQFSVSGEQQTASDGWATVVFSALGGFPVSSKQELLVIFVRASAPGESVIGGISARLLVSFHVSR